MDNKQTQPSVNLAFELPLQNFYDVLAFGNFRVNTKHKDALIKSIYIIFISDTNAKVIISALDKDNLEFRKEFMCSIKKQNMQVTKSCLVKFTRIKTDVCEWYGLSSNLLSYILAD